MKKGLLLFLLISFWFVSNSQKVVFLTKNDSYMGGSLRTGMRIEIGSQKVKKVREDGSESEFTITAFNRSTGEYVLSFLGFQVLMKDNAAQKKIYFDHGGTDMGWFFYETQKEREVRLEKERIQSEKEELARIKQEKILQEQKEAERVSFEKEVGSTKDAIRKNLKEGNEVMAISLYWKNCDKYPLTDLKEEIYRALSAKRSQEIVVLNSSQQSSFLEINKDVLAKYAIGSYTFNFDEFGKSPSDINLKLSEIPTLRVGSIEIPDLLVGDRFLEYYVISKNPSVITLSRIQNLGPKIYGEAEIYCSNLNELDLSWRIPSVDEMKQIVSILKGNNTNLKGWYWALDKSGSQYADMFGISTQEVKSVFKYTGNNYFAVSDVRFFLVPMKSKVVIEIVEKTRVLETKYSANMKSNLFKKGDVYFSKSKDIDLKIDFAFDENLPKNLLRVSDEIEVVKMIGDKIIAREVSVIDRNVEIIKKLD